MCLRLPCMTASLVMDCWTINTATSLLTNEVSVPVSNRFAAEYDGLLPTVMQMIGSMQLMQSMQLMKSVQLMLSMHVMLKMFPHVGKTCIIESSIVDC